MVVSHFILPLVVLGAPFVAGLFALFFFEYIENRPRIRHGMLIAAILYACFVILFPTPSPFFNYMIGLMSIVHIMRAIELFLVYDISSLKRLRKFGRFYRWESLPRPCTADRLFWTLDLISNFRAIGWSHGPIKCRPSPCLVFNERGGWQQLSPNAPQTLTCGQFIRTRLQRVLIAYICIDFYQVMFDNDRTYYTTDSKPSLSSLALSAAGSNHTLQKLVKYLASIITAGAFLDGSQALGALITVGALRGCGTISESWMWPPVFGNRFVQADKKDGFNYWWHDILLRPFWVASGWLLPSDTSWRSHMWAIFGFTATLHAVASYTTVQDAGSAIQVFISMIVQPVATIYLQPSVNRIIMGVSDRPTRVKSMAWLCQLLSLGWVLCSLYWLWSDPGLHVFSSSIPLPYSVFRMSYVV